jgi:hypothetical protein
MGVASLGFFFSKLPKVLDGLRIKGFAGVVVALA